MRWSFFYFAVCGSSTEFCIIIALITQGVARKGTGYDTGKQVRKKIFHAAVQMHGLG
jgi:hypothetical protein